MLNFLCLIGFSLVVKLDVEIWVRMIDLSDRVAVESFLMIFMIVLIPVFLSGVVVNFR